MLHLETDIYCGVFDSGILRKNTAKSQDRTVACYEIELFHTDTGTSFVQGEKFPTKRGMLLFAKPDQVRHSDFPVRCSFIRIFAEGAAREGLQATLSSLPSVVYLEKAEEIEDLMRLFSQLAHCFLSTSIRTERVFRANGLFYEILYRCLRACRGASESKDSFANPLVRHAYEYINEHSAENCSLPHLAQILGVSPNYLHTVFLRQVGVTPLEYLTQKRVERAKKLMAAGELSMLEIALEVGFCSQSHFNRVFKQKAGMTPLEYRRHLLTKYE